MKHPALAALITRKFSSTFAHWLGKTRWGVAQQDFCNQWGNACAPRTRRGNTTAKKTPRPGLFLLADLRSKHVSIDSLRRYSLLSPPIADGPSSRLSTDFRSTLSTSTYQVAEAIDFACGCSRGNCPGAAVRLDWSIARAQRVFPTIPYASAPFKANPKQQSFTTWCVPRQAVPADRLLTVRTAQLQEGQKWWQEEKTHHRDGVGMRKPPYNPPTSTSLR